MISNITKKRKNNNIETIYQYPLFDQTGTSIYRFFEPNIYQLFCSKSLTN